MLQVMHIRYELKQCHHTTNYTVVLLNITIVVVAKGQKSEKRPQHRYKNGKNIDANTSLYIK